MPPSASDARHPVGRHAVHEPARCRPIRPSRVGGAARRRQQDRIHARAAHAARSLPPRRRGGPARSAPTRRPPPLGRGTAPPRRSTGFTYVITATGTSSAPRAIVANTPPAVAPAPAPPPTPPGSLLRPSPDRSAACRPRSRRRPSAHRPQQVRVDRRESARDVRDERLPPRLAACAQRHLERSRHRRASSAASTVSRSLSPRPDRHTNTRAPSGNGRAAASRSRAPAPARAGCPRSARAPGTPRAPPRRSRSRTPRAPHR